MTIKKPVLELAKVALHLWFWFWLPTISLANPEQHLPLWQYGIDTVSSTESSPPIRIRDITQTRDGFIWLATASGLVRFDGVNFKTFDNQFRNLSDNEISSLVEDNDGALWIGTYGGGLIRYLGGEFTQFMRTDGLPDDSIRKVDKDQAGDLWIATVHGLARYSHGTFTTFAASNGLRGNFISGLCANSSQGVFVVAGNRLHHFTKDHFETITNALESDDGRLAGICSGQDGAIWMTFENSRIKRWKEGKLTIYRKDKHNISRPGTIHVDKEGTIWVGSREGLVRYRNGIFQTLATPGGQANLGLVLSMFTDREGNLWLGTEANGLARLHSVSVHTLTAADGLSDTSVNCVYRDTQSNVWIGAYSGYTLWSHAKLTAFTQMDGHPIPGVTSISEDEQGRIWMAAGPKLFMRQAEQLVPIPGWTNLFDIKVIASDSDANMWMGTDGDGLIRVAPSGKISSIRTPKGLVNNHVRAICYDRGKDVLWVGTIHGLSSYHDGKFTNYTMEDGLPSNLIYSIYADKENTNVLWITTHGGLCRLQAGKFFTIGKRDGLPANFVSNVLDDDRSNLWLSVNYGICSVRKADLEALADGRIKRVNARSFGARDGLNTFSIVASQQPNACKGDEKRLLFGSLNGLVVVNPISHHANTSAPPVYIEQVAINSHIQPLNRPPELQPGEHDLEILYTAPSFTSPEKILFKYRLEGLDRNWVEARQRRVAHYANLPPGSYRFQVLACNSDGIWNPTGASYKFQLPPRFYQTAWFTGLIAIAVAGLWFGAYRWRVYQLKANERELTQRVAEAVAHVKVLSGLLPICSGCKKIRDDKGYWNKLEVYMMSHADITFTHGLCPDCIQQLYPELTNEISAEPKAEKLNRSLPASDESATRLRDEQQLFCAFLDALPDRVYFKDLAGRFLRVNRSKLARHGLTQNSEILGKTDFDFEAEEQAREYRRDEEEVIRTGKPKVNVEARVKNADGSWHWVLLDRLPLRDPEGRITGIIGITRDITAHKQMEDQLLRAERIQTIGNLSSGVAHDLNNIFAPFLLGLPILREEAKTAETRRFLDLMENSIQRGADIVKQLLLFGRGGEPKRVPIKPEQQIRDLAKMIHETFPKKLTLNTRYPEDLWPIHADPTQVYQVLLNLSVNARDAMQEGGTLTITAENVRLDERLDDLTGRAKPGPYVLLTVRDTGSGISPEVLQHIFDPFFSTKEVGKGTGLGLSVVAGVVEKHDGFITVKSTVGQGSEFNIYLPALPASATGTAPVGKTELPNGHGELILAVDDEPAIVGVLAKILEMNGYKTITAYDGKTALKIFPEHPISAVITDFSMPGMDGLALAEALRKIKPAVGIILTTGVQEQLDTAKIKQLDLAFVLKKPFTAETMLRALQKLLSASQVQIYLPK